MTIVQLVQTAASRLTDAKPVRVGVRELSRATSNVLSSLYDHRSSEVGVVTFRGIPRFLLLPIDPDELTSLALSATDALELSDRDVEAGEKAVVAGRLHPVPAGRSRGK